MLMVMIYVLGRIGFSYVLVMHSYTGRASTHAHLCAARQWFVSNMHLIRYRVVPFLWHTADMHTRGTGYEGVVRPVSFVISYMTTAFHLLKQQVIAFFH